jgi:hypothetical protein
MKQLIATVRGWFAHPEMKVTVPSESERRLQDLQASGQVQFLP